MLKIWLIIKVLSLLALFGFIGTGLLFAIIPEYFTGAPILYTSALWHSLALAFMATVSSLAFMIAFNPHEYWKLLIPLAVGKATSSVSSLFWFFHYQVEFLMISTLVDGSIALISIILFLSVFIRLKDNDIFDLRKSNI